MSRLANIFSAFLLGSLLLIGSALAVGTPYITSDFPRIGGRTIQLWDVQKGSVALQIEGLSGSGVTSLSFSPDGKYLAGGVGADVKIWLVEGGRLYRTLSGHERPITGLAWSTDSTQLASCSMDNTVRRWRLDREHAEQVLTGHGDAVSAVSFIPNSPNSSWLASSSLDGTIRLTDIHTGAEKVLNNGASIQFLVYVPSTAQLLSGDYDGVLKLWDWRRGTVGRELGRHRGRILSLAVHGDAQLVASSSWEDGLWLWDLRSGQRMKRVTDGVVICARFVNGGRALALVNSQASARVVEHGSLRQRLALGYSIASLAVSGDGRLLATGEGPVVPEPRLFTLFYGVGQYQQGAYAKAPAALNEMQELIAQTSKGAFVHVPVQAALDDTLQPKALEALFRRVREQVQPQDIFVFYFAGQVRSVLDSQHNTQAIYLVPPNLDLAAADRLAQQGISARQLGAWIEQLPARNRMMILDGEIAKTVALDATQQLSGAAESGHGGVPRNTRVLVLGTSPESAAPQVPYDGKSPTLTSTFEAQRTDELTAKGLSRALEQVRRAHVASFVEGDDFVMGFMPGKRTIPSRGGGRIHDIEDRRPVRQGRDFALMIATNDYVGWPHLDNPSQDAKAIGDELRDGYNFEIDTLKETDTVSIKTRLKAYLGKTFRPDDQLLIYLAGHGDWDVKERMGYLVANNSKAVENDKTRETYLHFIVLLDLIKKIPCQHILIVIDTCYGGMLDEQLRDFLSNNGYSAVQHRGRDDDDAADGEGMSAAAVTAKLSRKTRVILASTTNTPVSDGKLHSPFALKLLEVLRRHNVQRRPLTLSKIQSGLELLYPQPHIGDFGSDPGRDFLFFARPK